MIAHTLTGNWIPEGCKIQKAKLEDMEQRLEGENKEKFLNLIKAMLQWRPEDRNTARELLEHPWLQGVFWPPGVLSQLNSLTRQTCHR